MYIELDKYIAVLDKRLQEKDAKILSGAAARKNRQLGSPSLSKPPPNAPSWSYKKDYQSQGNIYL